VAESRAMLARAMERTRHLMFELRPALLEAYGLKSAIEELATEAGNAAGFAVDTRIEVGRYSQVTEDLAYRTVREAIANARKHATASRLSVMLAEHRGGIAGTVRDDGYGFETGSALDRRMGLHIGLDTMTERIRLVDGTIAVRSEPGGGTEVEFWIPATPRPNGYEPALPVSPSK
jgi:two-component system sensor histidine kinase DegS